MAHIPYGYRIRDGKAVPEPDEAARLNAYIEAYLGGMSVEAAMKASQIGLSRSALVSYLRKGTYAGTDYYPPIVPEGTWERVKEAMARRTHPGFSNLPIALPIRTKFQTTVPALPCEGCAAEVASAIYDLITPAEYGRTFMNTTEQAMVRAWVGI